MINLIRKLIREESQVNLTEGSIRKPLVLLTTPLLISSFLQVAYNLVDIFWLGRLGTEALAAVTFVFPLNFLMISLGMGLSVAGSVLVAKFIGQEESDRANFAASQVMLYVSVFSVLVGLTAYTFSKSILSLLGAEGEVLVLANQYFEIIALGLVVYFGYSVFNSLLRGYGDTITPMLIMFGAVLLNIILDPLLIFGWFIFPELGVEGAALATIISRGAGFILGLYILFFGVKGLKISISSMIPDPKFFYRVVKLGVPASIGTLARAASVNVILVIVATFPEAVIAAYGIITRIYSAVYMPSHAVSRSVETMTAQNYGAKAYGRVLDVNKLAFIYSFLIWSVFGLIAVLFPEQIVGIFSEDPEVITAGSEFLGILALTFGFVVAKSSFNGGIRGFERTGVAAIASILALWLLRVPIAYFAPEYIGEAGIYWAFAISNIAGMILSGTLFYILWRKNKLRLTEDS